MRFYLGVHHPNWLSTAGVPLFVSHRRLAGRKTMPRAHAPWALDSGGFTELSMHGRWLTTPVEYVRAIRRYACEIGRLEWVAPQDWMCEPGILAATGLSVNDHHHRTCENLATLRTLLARTPVTADVNVIPVLTGWTLRDFERHYTMWGRYGVDLEAEPLVGLGTVCRRQHTAEIGHIVKTFAHLNLHGFGVKIGGLERYGDRLLSADSMAWSYAGRRTFPGCTPSHKNEANCLRFALAWRERLLATVADAHPDLQEPLF
ncbi:deazapurine DNA modification protein DpdA family protein [[Actinomadura] parvosata]|uniref:deazapurine DNA modification protein DpdA family protein n=1 Tax=[Actinomadura] parvosata TaxID=1955412 RepID=UPI00406C8B80